MFGGHQSFFVGPLLPLFWTFWRRLSWVPKKLEFLSGDDKSLIDSTCRQQQSLWWSFTFDFNEQDVFTQRFH